VRECFGYDAALAVDSRAVAKVFGVPHTVLAVWQQEGFVDCEVVTPEQWATLNMIRCAVWDNRRVIRAMLANLPKRERRRLLDDCDKPAIARIVYYDFLRAKLTGKGLMSDGRLITYEHYGKYLSWRHPQLQHLLTRKIFEQQRKSAENRIRYCRKHGTLPRLIADLGLVLLADNTVANPWIRQPDANNAFSGRNIFHD